MKLARRHEGGEKEKPEVKRSVGPWWRLEESVVVQAQASPMSMSRSSSSTTGSLSLFFFVASQFNAKRNLGDYFHAD